MLLIAGFILATLIATLAYRVGSLDRSGALAAIITGGLIFGLGGIPWAALLLLFFISSSVLSRAFAAKKTGLSDKYSKGARRDYGQVLANGGLGALLAVAHFLFPLDLWPWVAYIGAMAAVNADTWATELGVLSATAPRLITNWRYVERGTSGGVTTLGYLAVLAGAVLIGFGAVFFSPTAPALTLMAAAALAGLAGSSFDSLLGATVQGIYYCPRCHKETERHPQHGCGTGTILVRGWRWLNNDLVNVTCSLVGAALAVAVWLVLS